jgi:DNA-binding NarL/FixJ family response regulator
VTALLLVEDNPHLRRALVQLLAPHYAVHAVALARTALAQLDEVEPALAVVDLGLPDADGVELVAALRTARLHMPILVLTIDDTRHRIRAALDAGASGYLLKDSVAHELVPALEAALAGEMPLSPRVATHVVGMLRAPPDPAPSVTPTFLTGSERRVLDELARGLTYEQIGIVLDISINTVRSCVRTLYKKLDVASRTEAVVVAAGRGLLQLTPG